MNKYQFLNTFFSNRNLVALALLFAFLLLPSTSHAWAGWYVPSNPDAKNYTCTRSSSMGCQAEHGSKITFWQYYGWQVSHGTYKNRGYKYSGVFGPCTSNWRGRSVYAFTTTQADLEYKAKSQCKGPLKSAPGGSGSPGSVGPVAAHTCPTKHSNGTIVNYSTHPLCCSPSHSSNFNESNGTSSSQTHK